MVNLELSTITTTTLLRALHEPGNESVWHELDARYRPIIVAFARRLGLDDADAADAAQETLAQLFSDYRAGKHDPQRGRLRDWMMGIARHRIADVHRGRAARRERRGESAIATMPDDADLSRDWDTGTSQVILARALALLTDSGRFAAPTIEAFQQVTLEQRPVEDVARALQMSVGAVYLAKHRCLNRLREIMAELRAAYDND